MPQKIINLNTKSHYSLLQSCLSIDQIINYSLDNQFDYACLIDIHNMHGALEFYHQAMNHHLKPIIGIEIQLDLLTYLLVALDYDGYLELVKISSDIETHQPLQIDQLKLDHCAVIGIDCLVDCHAKEVYTSIPGYPNTIAVKDAHYAPDLNSYISYQVMQAIDQDHDFDLEACEANFNLDHSLATDTDQAFIDKYTNTTGFENLALLLSHVNWEMPSHLNHMVMFQLPESQDHGQYLQQLCQDFLTRYLADNHIDNPQVYWDRLHYELQVISDKNFIDYFLVVSDFIRYARNKNILIGPGRGSAAGSLVAFCLAITKVDPIKYNLIFERFLNPVRTNMPDIDTDVMDKARDVVVDYLFKKYGNQNVGLITTFQTFKAKMAIRDVGKLFKIDAKTIDVVAKSLELSADDDLLGFVKNTPKLLKFYESYPRWFEVAHSLLNAPRQVSTHAAGVVLSDQPLDTVCPIMPGMNNHIASQYAWNYLEEIGLIKMDVLGLKNLSVIDSILKIIHLSQNIQIDLDQIPLDDPATYRLLSEARTNGIFQLESAGMKKLVYQVKPQTIEDIAMINALFRPGPLSHINEFVDIRNQKLKPTYLNPTLEQVLKSTYGIILYQEQVIEIVQLVARFDAAKADIFRKAISKKDESKMINLKSEFLAGAIQNGYSQEAAETIYKYIFDFANYGFNHSHAIAYSIISYWMAYLKTHYPVPFFVSLLTDGDNSKEKILNYVNEAKQMGIQFLSPDINYSNNYFAIINNQIIFSFNSISGIGKETSNKIIEIRSHQPNGVFEDGIVAITTLVNAGINKKVINALIQIGAFDNLGYNRHTLLANLDEIMNKAVFVNKETNQPYFDFHIQALPDYSNQQKADIEAELIGISLTEVNNHALFDQYQAEYQLVSLDQVGVYPVNVIATLNHVTMKVSQKTKKSFANVSWTIDNHLVTTILFSNTDIESVKQLNEKQNYIISLTRNPKNQMYSLKGILKHLG